jgi:hypothetical protein
LPSSPLVLGPGDLVEFEDEYEELRRSDVPSVVAERRGSKLVVHGAFVPSTVAPFQAEWLVSTRFKDAASGEENLSAATVRIQVQLQQRLL